MRFYSNHVLPFTLLLGLGFSVILGWSFYTLETEAIIAEFEKRVENQITVLERELSLNFEALYAIKGLFDSSENVTADEFKRLTSQILVRQKNIQALEWAPKLSHHQRIAFEHRLQERHPEFRIMERHDQVMIPANIREEYFPVTFVEPFSGNEAALGFDIASNPKRLVPLRLARQSGDLIISASITLVQTNKKGFLAFLPIYNGEPDTIELRQQQLTGFAIGVFKIDDLIDSSNLYESLPGNFALIDETTPTEEIIYSHNFSKKTAAIVLKKKLELTSGRQWSIIASPSEEFFSEHRSYTPIAIFLLAVVFLFAGTAYTYLLTRHKNELEKMTLVDGLTGIANRRHFDTYLEQEWARARRYEQSLSLIMIDIDHFKQFNDHYGHLAGDDCLKRVAQTLQLTTQRAPDLLARYGGEEFAIILPNISDATTLAEQCRQNIENTAIPHAGSPVAKHITISIGVSTVTSNTELHIDDLIRAADQALYKAKESGRNKTCTL